MRVKIYQINPERDNNRMKFMSLSDSQSPDPSIYDEVFDAEIDENELEEIYGRFNTVGHPLFRGHSLSVSDVTLYILILASSSCLFLGDNFKPLSNIAIALFLPA